MKRGWIKLYRKIEDNPIWLEDRTAWFIFEYILIKADRVTGEYQKSYRSMSDYLDISTTTIHDAVKRLVAENMINIKIVPNALPNAPKTIFCICNWNEYQSQTERHSEQSPNALYSNTRNKEEYIEILNYFNEIFKKSFKSVDTFSKNADHWLKTYSIDDIKKAIRVAKTDQFWSDKMTPDKLFRTKNTKGENVDYIGDLINKNEKPRDLLSRYK